MEDTEQDRKLREAYLKTGKNIRYGTAGFRDLAENIEYVMRMPRCRLHIGVECL
jgi:hypothetical protein